MAKQKGNTPSDLELQILKVLWMVESDQESPLSVREIRLQLAEEGRELAHTSVITTLNIMVKKKFVARRKRKNAFLFYPLVSKDSVNEQEVSSLLDRVFDGSAEQLLLALFDAKEVDSQQITEMKKLINRKARQMNKPPED